jgi:hypothetical protein
MEPRKLILGGVYGHVMKELWGSELYRNQTHRQNPGKEKDHA